MKTNRSYQLRTGQMKLPIRKIEQVQYVDSKNVQTNIHREPIIGSIYKYRDKKIICIQSPTKSESRCYMCAIAHSDCKSVSCIGEQRTDNTTIILAPYNA
jgi:hypothetical protein